VFPLRRSSASWSLNFRTTTPLSGVCWAGFSGFVAFRAKTLLPSAITSSSRSVTRVASSEAGSQRSFSGTPGSRRPNGGGAGPLEKEYVGLRIVAPIHAANLIEAHTSRNLHMGRRLCVRSSGSSARGSPPRFPVSRVILCAPLLSPSHCDGSSRIRSSRARPCGLRGPRSPRGKASLGPHPRDRAEDEGVGLAAVALAGGLLFCS
jgi:hypothetical protein